VLVMHMHKFRYWYHCSCS